MRQRSFQPVILVCTVWAAAFMDGVLTQDFIALEIVTPVMMMAAAALFVRNGRNGDK